MGSWPITLLRAMPLAGTREAENRFSPETMKEVFMHKSIIVAGVFIGFVGGCVTPDPTPLTGTLHQSYRGNDSAPRQTRRYAQAPERPRLPGAPRFQPSWYPQGRPISPRWTHIILHHSATDRGGALTFDKYHRQKGWDELGYHFVIGNGTDTPDGYIEVGSRWNKQKHGAHCKTPNNYFNDHGIGICLVGDFTNSKPTLKQLAAAENLTRFLADQCSISPHRVTSHTAVKGKSTQCPGRHFPMGRIRHALSDRRTITLGR